MRSYEIVETPMGWKLTMYENGVEFGCGVGGPEDYDFLLHLAEEFCGDE